MFLLDSGLHVADAVTEAPAARDVGRRAGMMQPLWCQTAEGRLAATCTGNLDAARASAEQRARASGLVMLCHSLFEQC
jgi:hypothetical protein